MAQPTRPPEPDSIRTSRGLWAFSPELFPMEDALAYRIAQSFWTVRTLREAALLKPEFQAREDSLGWRLLTPRRTGTKLIDPTTTSVAAQLDAGTVELGRMLGDVAAGPRVRFRREDYLRRLTATNYRQLLVAEAQRSLTSTTTTASRKGLVKIDLPMELPSQLQTIFGEGKPNLSVTGSERITFSGTSRWRPKEQTTEISRRQSKFPQLDMKQELNLKLTGTIGDKVSVDVDQSSQTTTPLANRIKIKYDGYDDEILQRVDLGNTNLSLPGTQYVSAGGRAEGLFGINAQAKLGDIDVTAILSKQEGKSDAKSVTRESESHTVRIDDFDYVHGKYFFLRSPNGCPWAIDKGSIEVYVDDQIGSNNNGTGNPPRVAVPGAVTVGGVSAGPDSTYVGMFHRLTKGDTRDAEYTIEEEMLYAGHPVIILREALSDNYCLAVQYSYWDVDADYKPIPGQYHTVGTAVAGDTLRLQMLRPPQDDQRVNLNDIRAGVWGPTRDLELRNVYDLGARGILKDGFELSIRLKRTDGTTVNPDGLEGVSFLRMTALDLSVDEGSGPVPGHDGKVDDFGGYLIDYQNGLLYFPDLRPFDPDAFDLCQRGTPCFGTTICRYGVTRQREERPRPLPGSPSSGPDSVDAAADARIYRAPAIYDRIMSSTQNREEISRYYLELTYKSPVSRIQLNAFGILPGSEVVTASNRTLTRDRDYRIDYEAGEVEILDAAGVTEKEEIQVTYTSVGFGTGGASKTLAGASAAYRPEESKLGLSTAWVYEGKGGLPGAEGRRPRLGQEPSRTIVGELAGTWKGDSGFLTRLVDALPGLDARVPSKLDLAFGAGLSLPNPNTRDKLYIDDFDGAKDVMNLSMSRLVWRACSIPLHSTRVSEVPPDSTLPSAENKGDLWWYSPLRAVRERDLQPTLQDTEGDDNRQVLRLRLFPRGETPQDRRKSWSGVTTVLSKYGSDLSRAQFLDIWVNDFRQWRPQPVPPGMERRGRLIVDLGTTSEDAMWYRNDPRHPESHVTRAPNDTLDTEDTNGDLQLDLGTSLNEDTGLDRKKSGSAGADPYDRYEFDESLDENAPDKYAHVNGTEGNRVLDSEDLNGDGQLDRMNSYFQIEIDLADSNLWETDVYRDYVYRNPNSKADWVTAENGWRRIRIPLRNDTLVTTHGDPLTQDPVWEKIQHCRVWVTGFDDSTTIELGGIEITGNRWYENRITNLRDRAIPDSSLSPGEEFFVGVLNNKDDAAIYDTPIRTRKQEGITEREQSITLNMRQFPPGHRCSIYRTYSSKQDYTLYENMQFYLKQREVQGETNLTCAIRLCRDAASDTTNYYEYRRPVSSSWDLVKIDFAELSQLQLLPADSADATVRRDLGGGVVITRKGSPSLTSIQRIGFFVSNTGTGVLGRGDVWIDELHLTSVKRDPGLASRFALGAEITRLGRFNFNWERRGADFLKIGQDRGSGTTSTTWNVSGSTDLFGYAENLGLNSNLRGAWSHTRNVPKFRTESDLVVDRPTDRDIAETRTEELNFTLSRRRTERWWSRYLLETFSVSGGWRRAITLQPTSRDTTLTRNASLNWTLPLEQWGDIALDKSNRYKLRFLPTSLGATLTGTQTAGQRSTRTDLLKQYAVQPYPTRTTGGLNLSTSLRPVTPINYQISSARDLMLRHGGLRLGGLNAGREVSRQHNLNGAWQVPVLRQALGPSTNWQSSSTLRFSQVNSGGVEGDPDRVNDYQNSRTIGLQGRFSMEELWRTLGRFRARLAGDSTAAAPAPRAGAAEGGGGSGRGLGRLIRINPIGANVSFTRQSAHTVQVGEPGLLYQLGISDRRGGSARSLSRARARNSTGRTVSFDTNVNLPASITVGTRASETTGDGQDNGLKTSTLTRKWPDLTVGWGSLHQKLHIDRWFRSFSANTSYNREKTESGSIQGKERTSIKTNFAPFLNINATLKNGVTANFTSSVRSSTDDVYRPSRNSTNRRERSLGLTLKKSLNLTRRVTVPLTGRTQTVQTRMDLTADLDWSQRKAETRSLGTAPTVTENRENWKFAAGVGYQFTQSISGNGSLNFGQDKDNKNQSLTARFIGISLSASFNF